MFPASVPFAFQCENVLSICVKIHGLSSAMCQLRKVLKESFILALVQSFFSICTFGSYRIYLCLSTRTSNLTVYVKHPFFSHLLALIALKSPVSVPVPWSYVRSMVLLGALLLKSWLIFLNHYHVL